MDSHCKKNKGMNELINEWIRKKDGKKRQLWLLELYRKKYSSNIFLFFCFIRILILAIYQLLAIT